ncbi:hypothetical protein ACN077_03175 [Clostridium chromiireducens]
MKLTRYQEELLDKTDQLMKENNLIETENYAKFISEAFHLKNGRKR